MPIGGVTRDEEHTSLGQVAGHASDGVDEEESPTEVGFNINSDNSESRLFLQSHVYNGAVMGNSRATARD